MRRYFLFIMFFCIFLILPAHSAPYIIGSDNLGVDTSWAQFQVKIKTDKKCYKEGEYLKATITANRDCYITVYYTNDQGYCLIVFPNSYSKNNFIRAGQEFVIGNNPNSFMLKVDKHEVRDYLQVIATDEPIDTMSLVGISNPKEFIAKIRLILKDMVEARKKELGETNAVELEKRVFAIGATDYLCNIKEYRPPSNVVRNDEAKIPYSKQPELVIRSIVPSQLLPQYVGPSNSTPPVLAAGCINSISGGNAIILEALITEKA